MARLQANDQRVFDGLAASIEAAIARRLDRPVHPQLAGWVIVGMLERAVHYAVLVEDHTDLDQLAGDLIQLELEGLIVDAWEDVFAGRREQR